MPPQFLRYIFPRLHYGMNPSAVFTSAICKHGIVELVAFRGTCEEHISANHHRRCVVIIHDLDVLTDDKMLGAIYVIRCVFAVVQLAKGSIDIMTWGGDSKYYEDLGGQNLSPSKLTSSTLAQHYAGLFNFLERSNNA